MLQQRASLPVESNGNCEARVGNSILANLGYLQWPLQVW
jgi:hypothetical protein